MFRQTAILLLLSGTLFAAEFQTGQAARAVLGQSSFSSRDAGFAVASMSVSRGFLYAADESHHVLTFDLSRLPAARDDFSARMTSGCAVCGFAPVSVVNETVMPGVAAVSLWGKTVAVADSLKHRVYIWRDSSSPKPDVVLGQTSDASVVGPGTLVNPVSVALDGKRIFVGDSALHRVLIWNSLPVSADQPADVVLGQPDFAASNDIGSPEPDSISNPSSMASDGTNLFVADSINRRILVFSPADTRFSADAVVNSASLAQGSLAPGTLISLSAPGLSDVSESADVTQGAVLPKRLGGTEVIFDGQALPLLMVSPAEAQAQIPFDVASRSAANLYIRTQHSNGTVTITSPIGIRLAPADPGLFAFSGNEPRAGILLHSPRSDDQGGQPIDQQNPAVPGEVVTIWATGLGTVAEANAGDSVSAGRPHQGAAVPVSVPVTAHMNGEEAQVISATLPEGAIGVYKIEIAVPPNVVGASTVSLYVAQGTTLSNTVVFPLLSRSAENHSAR